MDKFAALNAFCRVVERGSFTAAAEDLGITHTAVSKMLRALESELGTQLINRTTRKLALTEAGRAFHARATDVLEQLAEAERALMHQQAAPRGLLRVNAPMAFGTLHLAPALPGFLRVHPEVRVELVLNDRFVDLIEEGFDVGLRITRELPDSSLIGRRIATMDLVLCAAPDYLSARGVPAHPSELPRHDCLVYSLARESEAWRFESDAGESVEVKVSGPLTANTGIALREAAVAGLGITLSSDFIAGPDLAAGRLVRVLPAWRVRPRHLFALYPPNRHLSPKVRVFVDFVATTFRSADLQGA